MRPQQSEGEPSASWFNRRKVIPTIEAELQSLTRKKQKLTRQIRKLEPQADIEDSQASLGTRLYAHMQGMQDLKDALTDRAELQTEGWRRWYRQNFQYDTYVEALKSEEQRAHEKTHQNLKTYFPEEYQAQVKEDKVQAMSRAIQSEYWRDQIVAAQVAELAEAWAKRRQQQREAYEKRQERQREEEHVRHAEKAREREEEYGDMRLKWHELDR